MSEASEATGLDDYGDDRFVEPMTRYLESAVDEGGLNQLGAMSLQADVHRWLVNRLRWQRDLSCHPEIRAETVSSPIFITGLARTGTTKLHRMLARDPDNQAIPLWRNLNPAPDSLADPGEDNRLAVARGMATALAEMSPDFRALHPMVAEEPEEEVILLQMGFRSAGSGLLLRVPSYFEWLVEQPQQPMYTELAELLQYLQWQDRSPTARPWVLKTPLHLGRIDALFDVFPNATVVHCHRDLLSTMASFCRLIEAARLMRSDTAERAELGAFLLEWASEEWNRNLDQRDQIDRESQIIDVEYDAIRNDATGVIASIYRARGGELSVPAAERMNSWESDNPQHGYGSYTYSLEDYGVTSKAVAEAFHRYTERFPKFRVAP